MVNIRRIKKNVFENFGVASFMGDLILLNGLFLVAISIRYDEVSDIHVKDIKTLLVMINMAWIAMMFYGDFYFLSRTESIERTLARNIKFVFYLLIISYSLVEILHFDTISRLVHVYFFSMFSVAIFIFRLITIKVTKKRRKNGVNSRYVVILGGNITSQSIAAQIVANGSSGRKIIGVFNDMQENLVWDNDFAQWIGYRNDLIPFLKKHWVDELFVPINEVSRREFAELNSLCEKKFIKMKMLPNLNKFTMEHKIGIEFYGNLPVFSFIRTPLHNHFSRFLKKSFDYIFSILVILLIFSWLFPIIAILIKLSSKGPIFYKQERSGINNRTFVIYKFRSMTVNDESDITQATKEDPRVTKIGRFIRKTNIDELPQFFNVLKGEMSVVGPRPHMLKHTDEYSALIPQYLERHYILPGITGWAQVHGFRGETPELYLMEKRVEHDNWYVQNWSIMLDVRIIFLTTKNIILGEKEAY